MMIAETRMAVRETRATLKATDALERVLYQSLGAIGVELMTAVITAPFGFMNRLRNNAYPQWAVKDNGTG